MSAGGREDRDVRMLGKPFIIEITNPKKELFDMNEIINKINNISKFIQVNII